MAGIAEHVVMFPVDTIKTRMQVTVAAVEGVAGSAGGATVGIRGPTGMVGVARSIVVNEGVMRLLRGAQSVALGAGPAHALYFATYEKMRKVLGGDNRDEHTPLAAAATGAVATTVCDTIMTPFDVMKQRLQISGSPYRGVVDCARTMLRVEGFAAFFRSLPTTLVMNVPYAGFHFAAYESLSRVLISDNDHHPLANSLAGAGAGASAAALTTPLDVVKTRLQTQDIGAATGAAIRKVPYRGMVQTARTIVAEEGLRGLFAGMVPRMLFFAPGAAIAWTTYETLKHLTRHWASE
ncbi:mitoferrin-1 [Thecamonas trahens ATCC 50062]|uniref:Mitoferrin-1 n=1 Tax=Thecamonas trahens ATCC 50062 TaxID=461836 RepID=A0A0L0DHH3_THETB|nr:mitoferrin-1 [Thecamonas trahens ATCC 50062]KNC51660.1 mitoferrin-1 [Thecamonas trahens ATCC 50062]|eukprot:XP_013755796.1 mitoferrin-1 [Thecamonas trahens ATCC 50062]